MKRIISLFITLGIILTSIPVFAENGYSDVDRESHYYHAISFFDSLGLIDGLYEDEFMYDVAMTRADFAIMFAKLTGFKGSGAEQRFSDVASDSPAFPYINYMYEKGYIEGDGDGRFRPNDGISTAEGVKIVLTALGYDEAAAFRGGFPSGYTSIALELGLLKGLSGEAALTRGDMCLLMYNALDKPMLVVGDIKDNGDYTLSQDENTTILSSMLEFEKSKGIFLANDKFSIYGNLTSGENYVYVNYKTYRCELNTDSLVGKYVSYYTDKDGNIVAVFDISEKEVNIAYDDILPVSTVSQIVYNEGNREETVEISSDAFYCYNGTPAQGMNDTMMKPEYGEISVIDYDGNGDYDCVMIWDYDIEVIKGVAASLGTAQTESGKSFDIDDELLIYKNGELADFSSVKLNDVALVAQNASTILFLSDKTVKGTVSALHHGEGIITVDGADYEIAPINTSDINIGSVYTLYFDKYGRVAYAKSERGRAYAYVQKIFTNEESLEINNKFFNEKGEFEVAPVKNKVSVYEGSELKEKISSQKLESYFTNAGKFEMQLVELERNSEGEITSVYLPEYADIDDYKQDTFICNLDSSRLKAADTIESEKSYFYNQYFYIEEKKVDLSFLTSTSTMVFYLPEKEKSWSVTTPAIFTSGQELPSIKAYNFSEDGLAGVVVIKATEEIDTTFTHHNTTFVVDNVYQEYNSEEAEVYKVVSGISEAGERVSCMASLEEDIECGTSQTMYQGAKLSEINKGDVITVIVNNNNEIMDFNILYKYGDEKEYAYSPYPDSLGEGSYQLLQREKSSFAYHGNIVGKGNNAVMVKNSLMSKTRSYLHAKAKVVVFDRKLLSASAGTIDDVCQGQEVFMNVYPAYGNLYIVIYN